MPALGLLLRAEVRRRWLAIVLIGLLAGVVGAATVAAVAGARRTSTAYDRLAEESGAPDATIISFVDPGFLDEVLALPEVEDAWPLRGVVGQALDVPEVTYLTVVSGGPRPDGLFSPLVVDGRLPADDAVGEVAADVDFAEQAGVEVGDRARIGFLTQEEFESFDTGFDEPDGPVVDMEVVGTFRVAGNASTESVALLGSPAFSSLAADAGGGDGAMVRLMPGAEAAARFAAGVEEASSHFGLPPNAAELGSYDLKLAAADAARNHASADVVARGLLLVGLAGLVIGGFGVGQALVRHQSRAVGTNPALPALGLDRRERIGALVTPFVLIAAPVAAVTTAVGAIALSPLFPIGSARELEPSPGVDVDLAIVLLGVGAVVVAFVGLVVLASRRSLRPPRRERASRHSLAGWSTRTGMPLPVAAGARLALEPGAGRNTVPVRAALVGAVVAVAAVVGATALAASLDRLVDTPVRYGSPGDVSVADAQDELFAQLDADPDVEAVLETHGFDLVLDGVRSDALSATVRKGSIGYDYLDGRSPSGPAEIALGPDLADRLDVGIGDPVEVGDDGQSATVVGIVLARGDTPDTYSRVAIVDDELRAQPAGEGSYREAEIRYAPGVDVEAAAQELALDWEVDTSSTPARIADVAQVRNLPLVLAGAAAVLGLVLLGHALVVTVRRRGHDLALVRALGARPRDTAWTVATMTATIVVIGVVVGVPVGLIVGNLAWQQLAGSLDVATDLAVPALVLALCLPVALLAGLAAAALPTWRAAHLHVADLLRRE